MKLDDILQAEVWIKLYIFHEGSYYEKADLWHIDTMWHDNKKPKYFISQEAVNSYKDSVVKRLESKGYAETTEKGTFYNKRSDNNMYYVSITDCKVKKENIVAVRDALFVLDIKDGAMYRLYDALELSSIEK